MSDNYYAAVVDAFDQDTLAEICIMPEEDFGHVFGMQTVEVDQPKPANFFHYQDNGSNLLAVAHLDTVMGRDERAARFVDTEDGLVVFSGALDDRLGAFVILDLLPKLGIFPDYLLTVGEEMGQSTAGCFLSPKEYNWGFEFDRGGTDVVAYEYEDADLTARIRKSGARVGQGSFSDISYLEHLEIKMVNWGVGYQDYHGPRSHAFLDDTFLMVARFLKFHEANEGEYLPHDQRFSYGHRATGSYHWSAERYDEARTEGSIWCSVHEEWSDDDDECFNCVIEADHTAYRVITQQA